MGWGGVVEGRGGENRTEQIRSTDQSFSANHSHDVHLEFTVRCCQSEPSEQKPLGCVFFHLLVCSVWEQSPSLLGGALPIASHRCQVVGFQNFFHLYEEG